MGPQYNKEVQNSDTALTKPMIRGSDCAYSIHAASFATTVAVAELVLLIGQTLSEYQHPQTTEKCQ